MSYNIVPIHEINENELYDFLLEIDEEFVPTLSKRINLREYPEKIKSISIGKVAMINGEIIGLSVYYPPNSEDNYIYLTLIAVKINFRKFMIGKDLINEMINVAQNMSAKGIKLQTWETATRLIAYYESFGFKPYDTLDNRGNGVKSVLLKIEF